MKAIPTADLAGALETEITARTESFTEGVRAYRRHGYRRRLADPPEVWRAGTTRLLDYGAAHANGADGPPVLIVPSLINRAYILDLTGRRSFCRYLAKRGFRPFLVDWDAPGTAETGFALDDYIAGRLPDMLDTASRLSGERRPVVVGYCMGGLLALGLARLRPEAVAALVLMATPWDFHADRGPQARLVEVLAPWLRALIDHQGLLPVDVIQALFASLDPIGATRKFRAFERMDPKSAKARDFVALEDWLNDGVPLAGPVARQCLFDWYAANIPARGLWSVAGLPVRPEEIETPSLVVLPEQDRIVPPPSAAALAQRMPAAETRLVPAGHIGMVAGRRAVSRVFNPLAAWIGKQSFE